MTEKAAPLPSVHAADRLPIHSYPYRHHRRAAAVDVDLRAHWRKLVDYRRVIAIVTGTSTAVALAVAMLVTPIYRAEVVLAPVTNDRNGGLSALSAQFGDLAALAGIAVGGGDRTQEAIATLRSRALTVEFIKDNDLLRVLFADAWDVDKSAWKETDPKKIPTLWQGNEFFDKKIRRISVDKKSGLVTLAIEWEEPVQAADWANELVKRVNRLRQLAAIQEAEKSIRYLEKQLSKTASVEVEQATYRLIEAQMKASMMANARGDFAFRVIDPAVPPEKKLKPKRVQIVFLGFMLGLLSAVFFALISRGSDDNKEDSRSSGGSATGR